MPPPGIIFGSGGPLTPPQPTTAAANPMNEESFRMASSSTPRPEKRRTNHGDRWAAERRRPTAAYVRSGPLAPRSGERVGVRGPSLLRPRAVQRVQVVDEDVVVDHLVEEVAAARDVELHVEHGLHVGR